MKRREMSTSTKNSEHLVCETHMIRSTLEREYLRSSLFISTEDASAKPRSECSVNTVRTFMHHAWNKASCPILEND